MHDNTLTPDNRDKFSYIADRYNQLVKFYNVKELCAEEISKITNAFPKADKTRFSIAMFYRFFIPQLLSTDIEKTIYLDADIIVNLDINELWQIELGDKILAAVAEIDIERINYMNTTGANNFLITNNIIDCSQYFNSGVLLMNLKLLCGEEENIMRGVKFVGEHPQLIYLDQDILNYLYAKDYLKLSAKFNFFVREARKINETKTFKRIYHFAGGSLNFNMHDAFNRCWMEYFLKTPWFDEEVISRLYSGFLHIYANFDANSRYTLIRFSAMMSGKARAFFMMPQNVEQLKELFSIRDDEDIILDKNQASLQDLVTAMRVAQGKKIFFIMVPNFPFDLLTQIGFVANKDFLNGLELLTAARGIDSYSLIKIM